MNKRKIEDGVFWFGGEMFSFYAVCGEKPALIELGVSQLAPMVAATFQEIAGAPPATIVAMHSHYDHAGGAARLKSIFPDARMAASAPSAAALSCPTEIRNIHLTMLTMNGDPLLHEKFPRADREVEFGAVPVDVVLRDGDVIETGGAGRGLQALMTPGHTSCSMALFHPDTGALFVSDACGMPLPSGRIWPTAFESFPDYLASLRRMLDLAPRYVCPAHFTFFREGRAIRFLEKSIQAAEAFHEMLVNIIDKVGADTNAALAELSETYDEAIRFIHPSLLRFGNRMMVEQVIAEVRG